MGFIIFALALFYRRKISSTKLMQGGYNLNVVFWMYGVLFTPLLAGGLGFYIYEKINIHGLEGKAIVGSLSDALSLFSAIGLEPVLNYPIAVKSKPHGKPQILPIRCQRRRMGVRRTVPDPVPPGRRAAQTLTARGVQRRALCGALWLPVAHAAQ